MHQDECVRRIPRREFLHTVAIGTLALGFGTSRAIAEDGPATHNMLVFGGQTMLLSHLPMFHGLNKAKTEFGSPHRYQVVLEAALTNEQLGHYIKDRKAHPDVRLYTLGPEEFVLSRLFTPAAAPELTSFTATVFRGHLEDEKSRPVPGLQDISVKIARVLHARQFDPRASKPTALEYLLVGGKEPFLVHAIFAPPDFDQVLSVSVSGIELTEADFKQDIRITIPDRKNVAAARLRTGQRVEAMLRVGSQKPAKVQLTVGPQAYFEEGELRVPPTFDPTAEEKNDK